MQARAVSGSSTVPRSDHRVAAEAAAEVADERDGARHRSCDLEHRGTPPAMMAAMARPASSRLRADDGHDADLADAVEDVGLAHRCTRAVPPFITRSTSDRLAMVVSPAVVMASAPCAAPHSTAHWAP
jgi:hypothetical protein